MLEALLAVPQVAAGFLPGVGYATFMGGIAVSRTATTELYAFSTNVVIGGTNLNIARQNGAARLCRGHEQRCFAAGLAPSSQPTPGHRAGSRIRNPARPAFRIGSADAECSAAGSRRRGAKPGREIGRAHV